MRNSIKHIQKGLNSSLRRDINQFFLSNDYIYIKNVPQSALARKKITQVLLSVNINFNCQEISRIDMARR